MKRRKLFTALLVVALAYALSHAQAPLTSVQSIDWPQTGVDGGIPARPTICARLQPSASLTEINAALASCPANQAVFLSAGTYSIPGSVVIPSHVTLRGDGADRTILNAIGAGVAVISLGSGSVPYRPLKIIEGAAARSTHIKLSSVFGISVGTYLVIADTNDPTYVTSLGSGGNCNWCDGGWTQTGALARGQIVAVTAVAGESITISPALYSAYANSPVAVPFTMSASYAGVENLQVRANNSGYATNFAMSACANCWIKGVASNYADGDHVSIRWGYRDEIRDSYFSNAFIHAPGEHDSDVQIALKTSASRIENNIIERTHDAVMLEWGAAGNVIAYNYTHGEFDAGSPNVVIGGIDFHGAHPQFNLIEGNVLTAIYADSVWGTSSHTTIFRNWIVGTNRVCAPLAGRDSVDCSGSHAHFGFQAARAVQISSLSTSNNFIANIVGSAQMQSLVGYKRPLAQKSFTEYPAPRSYDAAAYAWSFGYADASDDGSGRGCSVGDTPCHRPGTSRSNLFHGNFDNVTGSVTWAPGISRQLPASFYLAQKPAWWGRLPFPAIGPEVTGGHGPGNHSYGNPAQSCYFAVMGGSDGGAASPLPFNAGKCYEPDLGAASPKPGPSSNH
jgi:hypothetical protein